MPSPNWANLAACFGGGLGAHGPVRLPARPDARIPIRLWRLIGDIAVSHSLNIRIEPSIGPRGSPLAMETHTSPSEVNGEVARLKALVAAQAERIVELERQLSGLNLMDIAKAKPARRSPDLLDDQEVGKESAATEPIFPNEIFLLIGGQLEPGTRSLLSLARTCRATYSLLLPRLYEAFSVTSVYSKADPGQFQKRLDVPNGFAQVKRLDVVLDGDWEEGNRLSLMLACPNVTELTCDADMFFELVSRPISRRPNLKVLTIHCTTSNDGGSFLNLLDYKGMPKLRKLVLRGQPNVDLFAFISRFSPLNQVDIELDHVDCLVDWNPAALPKTFFERVRKWSTAIRNPIVNAMNAFPSFAPTDIFLDNEEPNDDAILWDTAVWSRLCALDSLKRLHIQWLRSSTLALGLPANLESLEIDFLIVDGLEPSLLPGLRARILSIPERTIKLCDPDEGLEMEMTEPELRAYLTEYEFWETIPGLNTNVHPEDIERFKKYRELMEMPAQGAGIGL